MVGEVLGSGSRQREVQRLERRGARGTEAAAHAAREAGGVPTPAAKDVVPSFRARTRKRRATFGSAGGAGSTPHNV